MEEEKESIEETMQAIEEYYDKLIKETEEYWDAIIDALEEQKSKWEELAEVESVAKAYAAVKEVFGELGYTVEDVLNGDGNAFEDFKAKYLQVLADMNAGNQPFLEGLDYASDSANTNFGKISEAAGKTKEALDPLKEPLDNAAKSTKDLGDNATTASGGVSGLASSTGELADKASDADEKLSDLTESTKDLPEQLGAIDNVTFENIISQLELLRSKLAEIKTALGSAATGSNGEQSLGGLGSIAGALNSLNSVTLDGLINQFSLLETAISSVCTLLGSGGMEGMGTAENGGLNLGPNATGEATGAATSLLSALQQLQSFTFADGITQQFLDLAEAIGKVAAAIGVGGEGAESEEGSLIGALEMLGETASAVLGGGESDEGLNGGKGGTGRQSKGSTGAKGEGEGEGSSGGIIGQFEQLTETIGGTAEAIGTTESDEGSEDLIGSIVSLGVKNDEVLNGGEGGKGVIADWEEFNSQLSEASGSISEMVEGLESLQDSYETELTVKLTIEGGGMFTGTATLGKSKGNYSLNILEAIGLPGSGGEWLTELKKHATGTAKLSGKANLFGNWAYEGGKTLIAELGPELVVFPDGHFETFDRPQMVDLPRNSVIFNHLQTEDILDKKNQIGKAHLNGTAQGLMPLSDNAIADMVNLANSLSANSNVMRTDLGDIKRHTEEISRTIQNITNNNSNSAKVTFGDLNFTCNGVSTPEVLGEIQNALNQTFEGMALNAYQRAMAR